MFDVVCSGLLLSLIIVAYIFHLITKGVQNMSGLEKSGVPASSEADQKKSSAGHSHAHGDSPILAPKPQPTKEKQTTEGCVEKSPCPKPGCK